MGTDKSEYANRSWRRHAREKKPLGTADWMDCDAGLLQKVIARAGYKQCALRFGYTRDGGAFSIGVYTAQEPFTDYIRPGEDIDAYLQELLEDLEEYDQKAPIQPQKERAKGK